MAEIIVEIRVDGPHYPRGQTVRRNDTVTFQLVGITGDVEVKFDTPCCFTSSAPFTLKGSSLAASMHQETVSSTVGAGRYYFTADIPAAARPRPPEWEAKRGELDVSTDPELPEDKRR